MGGLRMLIMLVLAAVLAHTATAAPIGDVLKDLLGLRGKEQAVPAPPEFKVTPEVKLFRVTPQGGLVTLDGQPTRHQLGFIKGIFGLGSQYKVIQTFQGGHQAIESVEGDGSFVSYLDNKKVRIDGWPPRFTEVQNRLFESNVDLYWLSSARSESTSKLPEAQAKSRTAALEKKGAKAWAENNALRQQIARETPAPPAAQPATADTHDPTPDSPEQGPGTPESPPATAGQTVFSADPAELRTVGLDLSKPNPQAGALEPTLPPMEEAP